MDTSSCPVTPKFLSVRKAKSGTLTYEKDAFLQGYGGSMDLRPKYYSVIAEMTPTSFEDNTLHTENYMVIDFTDPMAANDAIRQGLVIHGTRVDVRKKQAEPLRCLKCQVVPSNHLAANCKQLHDQCSQCRGFHRTTQCPETNSTQYYCANCKNNGHAAWDRRCPVNTFQYAANPKHGNTLTEQ